MAWYRNHYRCGDCRADWEDEWSCCCDDECPNCGSRNWSPYDSDDLTFVVEQDGGEFIVLMSPRSAEHEPDYAEVAVALSQGAAQAYVIVRQSTYWD
jgi:hypothetical protein